MAERIVKFRLITYFDETPSLVDPNGGNTLTERIAHFGEKVDITRDVDLKRLDDLGALYTEEEAAAIEDGSYSGPDRVLLFNARAGIRPAPPVEAAEGEHGDAASMDAAQLAEVIRPSAFGGDGKDLTVDETVALADDSEDSINKVLDAENIATDNEPRRGVVDRLEAKLNAATRG